MREIEEQLKGTLRLVYLKMESEQRLTEARRNAVLMELEVRVTEKREGETSENDSLSVSELPSETLVESARSVPVAYDLNIESTVVWQRTPQQLKLSH